MPSVTIGFVGLGEMGLPMAANLVESGRDVVGLDLDGAAVARAKAAGVRAGNVAEVEVLIVMVRTLPQVEAVLDGVDGPRVVVVMSTTDPGGMERIAARARGFPKMIEAQSSVEDMSSKLAGSCG